MLSKKEFAIITNLRQISCSSVEHEKSFIPSRPGHFSGKAVAISLCPATVHSSVNTFKQPLQQFDASFTEMLRG